MVQSAAAKPCPPRPWILYVSLVVPNLLDAWLTVLGLEAGIPEGNPLMRAAIEQGGTPGLWVSKVLGALVIVGLAETARTQCRRCPGPCSPWWRVCS